MRHCESTQKRRTVGKEKNTKEQQRPQSQRKAGERGCVVLGGGHVSTFKKKKKKVRITSYRECDTTGVTALTCIAGDRQTNAGARLQPGTGVCVCQAPSRRRLSPHRTRRANGEPRGTRRAAETPQSGPYLSQLNIISNFNIF